MVVVRRGNTVDTKTRLVLITYPQHLINLARKLIKDAELNALGLSHTSRARSRSNVLSFNLL